MKGVQKGKLRDPGAGHLRPLSWGRAKPPCTNPKICPVQGTPSRGRDGVLPDGLLRPSRSPWFQWRGQESGCWLGLLWLAGTTDPAGAVPH